MLYKGSAMPAAPPLNTHASGPAGRPARALSVLVADDEHDTVLTLVAILRDEGHDAHGVYNGDDVIKAARRAKPDVVVLDIELPGKSGFSVARELREMYHLDQPPLLIAISG